MAHAYDRGQTDVELVLRVVESVSTKKSPTRSGAVSDLASIDNPTPTGSNSVSVDKRTWTERVFDHFEALRKDLREGTDPGVSQAHVDVEGPYGSVMQVPCF